METYGRRVVVDMRFDAAMAEVTAAPAEEGFSIMSRLNVRDYLSRATRSDSRRYMILAVALPIYVIRDALRDDPGIGPLLPTSIAVFELADGKTAVAVAEPFGGLTSQPEWRRSVPQLARLADETCSRLAVALEDLAEDARTFAWLRGAVNPLL